MSSILPCPSHLLPPNAHAGYEACDRSQVADISIQIPQRALTAHPNIMSRRRLRYFSFPATYTNYSNLGDQNEIYRTLSPSKAVYATSNGNFLTVISSLLPHPPHSFFRPKWYENQGSDYQVQSPTLRAATYKLRGTACMKIL